MRRIFPSRPGFRSFAWQTCTAVAVFGLAAGTAQALSIQFAISPSESSVQVSVPALFASSNSAGVGGSIDGEITDTTIAATGGRLELREEIVLSPIGATITGVGLAGSLSGGPTSIHALSPNSGSADLLDWSLRIDEGILDLGALGDPIDLAIVPFAFALDETISTLANLTGNPLVVGDSIEWTIPILAVALLDVSDALPDTILEVVVTGQIVARGTVVPEPGSLLLLTTGVAGLASISRRRARGPAFLA